MSKIFDWFDAHPKTKFASRLVSYLVLSCVIPIILIALRFQIFSKVGRLSLSGWGMIIIIFVAVILISVVRYIKMALKAKYSMVGQILGGVCKIIIPMVACYVIVWGVKDDIQSFLDVFGIIIICEAVAIPLNPLPEWAYEMQKEVKENERKDTVDYCIDKFFNRKKEEESSGSGE